MIDFLKNPYLPEKMVRLAVCGKHNSEILDFIRSFGIELILSECNQLLDKPICNHIDLNVHYFGKGNIIIGEGNDELYKILSDAGLNVDFTQKAMYSPYPNDCALNCFSVGDYLFCNKNITEQKLLDKYKNLIIADVKQGYCKCSTLLLNDKCFITDDPSIYRKGIELSFDCLLIEKGDVYLEGYNYGFIGGAATKLDDATILFFGDITRHKSFAQIDNFIKSKGMKYIYSTEFPLTDIGGIIPIK